MYCTVTIHIKMHLLFLPTKGGLGAQMLLSVRKSQIRKFWGSILNRKSANFWGMRVRKIKNPQISLINPQIANRNPQIS